MPSSAELTLALKKANFLATEALQKAAGVVVLGSEVVDKILPLENSEWEVEFSVA